MLTTTLAQRLRLDTADDHLRAESALGLPASLLSRTDYARLVDRLISFHLAVEAILAEPRWRDDWVGAGIVLSDHVRSPLLEDDLRSLDSSSPAVRETVRLAGFASFGEVLGLLYVIEGSSLGGRVLGPLIRARLGDVPTRFYDGDGRDHPRPWRSLQAALTGFDDRGGDQREVVGGARLAFDLFGSRLDSTLWSSLR
ncbi:hypothetical protein GCM10025867_00870 [Frondihabitans sucicola]|uniref:Heme oxygenase n=1 Tax=Frondihabitans sucicola TaxID=1268041 RepID=A0ABN6XS79_9MICO|nr:biliverdin-producing heme oxygenase [Frondihabitans sucicola]BDZ47846.1 hypothetical protein GCM10025867_00870 [Frondihabitans sucicola]